MNISPLKNEVCTNYIRRIIGVSLGFMPLALLILSLIYGANKNQELTYTSIGFMLAALTIAFINLYLSFLRPLLFERKNGSMDGYRFASGIPLVGTLMMVFGLMTGFGQIGPATIGILAFILDTSGSGWFVVATWRDKSLWDEKK